MRTVSKRELNHRTAEVLAAVDESDEPIVVTERGERRWEIRKVSPDADPLARLAARGLLTPAQRTPADWPSRESSTADPAHVDRILNELRGSH